MRTLLQLHRYLGLIGGAFMLLWCSSGFVMMYVSYPELDETQRVAALTPIAWGSCCMERASSAGAESVSGFRIEMLGDRVVLSRHSPRGASLIDLSTGRERGAVSQTEARTVASAFAPTAPRAPRLLGVVARDQWTASGDFAPDQPFFHFALDDVSNTEVYVSSVTGQIAQVTTGRERFWNWLGPIPHWLYWFELRRRPELWKAVVMATSLVGCFLTLTGLYVGVLRWPARTKPGPRRWHHLTGLIFGLFALTWVGSGLMSIEPWGLLSNTQLERARLRGTAVSESTVVPALRQLAKSLTSSRATSVELVPLNGELYFVASFANGSRARFDALGRAAPLSSADFAAVVSRLKRPARVDKLTTEDSYFFSRTHDRARLPTYRMTFEDDSRVVYFDAVSGVVRADLDSNGKAYRWVQGLHRFDLIRALRARPLWDSIVLLLLGGVTAICATGLLARLSKARSAQSRYL